MYEKHDHNMTHHSDKERNIGLQDFNKASLLETFTFMHLKATYNIYSSLGSILLLFLITIIILQVSVLSCIYVDVHTS